MTESVAYTIHSDQIKIPFPQYQKYPLLGLGDITYKINLIKKTPYFKENQALNSTAVDSLPLFIAFDSNFITIEGNTFSEGWSSYNFQVTATMLDTIINNEFMFTIDTMVDCRDAKIVAQFNSTIYYLLNTSIISQRIFMTDSKSITTGI